MQALIFDCDGVLVDTERDGHRVAFNQAFKKKGLDIEWNEVEYGTLLQISGGKERMRHYFEQNGWPAGVEDREQYIKELHQLKTKLFMQIIEKGQLPLRAGVTRLIDEAIGAGITLAICSTSNEKAVNRIADVMLGKKRKKKFAGIFAGDVVSAKKPDPAVYLLAKEQLDLDPDQSVVIEDSRNGLLAAKGAGMHCVITKSFYTKEEDFSEAELAVDELGDKPQVNITLDDLKELCP
jgi:HAD superfamily hydrolase (TIGR01509 family)